MSKEPIAFNLLILIAVTAGCAESKKVDDSSSPPSSKPEAAQDEKKSATDPVEKIQSTAAASLIEATWDDLQALVADYKGKIVVVDVWSTACEPCMKEFPHLIELQKKHPDDVIAISFDVDYAGIKNKPVSFYRERVLKFLDSQPQSNLIHRMSTIAADDLFTQIKLDSIPAIYVYGRDGNLAKRFSGSDAGAEISYERQVFPLVEELVK